MCLLAPWDLRRLSDEPLIVMVYDLNVIREIKSVGVSAEKRNTFPLFSHIAKSCQKFYF